MNPDGYYEGHMAVCAHKGEWVLRARLESDRPVVDNPDAARAMSAWKSRNRTKSEELTRG